MALDVIARFPEGAGTQWHAVTPTEPWRTGTEQEAYGGGACGDCCCRSSLNLVRLIPGQTLAI